MSANLYDQAHMTGSITLIESSVVVKSTGEDLRSGEVYDATI